MPAVRCVRRPRHRPGQAATYLAESSGHLPDAGKNFGELLEQRRPPPANPRQPPAIKVTAVQDVRDAVLHLRDAERGELVVQRVNGQIMPVDVCPHIGGRPVPDRPVCHRPVESGDDTVDVLAPPVQGTASRGFVGPHTPQGARPEKLVGLAGW